MSDNNLRKAIFGSSPMERVSGYVVAGKNGRWIVRVVLTDRETSRRQTASCTIKGTRDDAERALAEAIQRKQYGYDTGFDMPLEALADITPHLRSKVGVIGAMSELLACAAILRRGYDCYRSVAATGACDLIALEPLTGQTCRVEVKTSRRTEKGLRFQMGATRKECHDVLALVVLKESQVEFTPPLKEWFLGKSEAAYVSNM